MAVKHIDRRIGSPDRDKPKMTGHEGETISEYFDFRAWPEKMVKKVTRAELLAVLDRWHRVNQEQKWYRRLWRFLSSPRGSGPVVIAALKEKEPETDQKKADPTGPQGVVD